MQINITFVIQVVNFCITYYFLDKILFKHLVTLLQKRDYFKVKALEGIEKKERSLEILQAQKISDLQEFKTYINDRYRLQEIKKKEMPFIIEYNCDDEQIRKIIEEGKTLLVESLAHAYKY